MTNAPSPDFSSLIKEDIRKAYNSIADTYSEWTKSHHAARINHLNILLEYLSQGISHPPDKVQDSMSVLELGCGSGQPVTAILASTQKNSNTPAPLFKVIANDISSQQLKLASEALKAFENVELKEADMMELSFEDGSLDAVLGMYALIHLPRDEQSILLKRIRTWLKPGGFFLGNFAVEELEALYDEAWLGCDADGGAMFWSSWGEEGTCKVMVEAGLEIVLREIVRDVEEGPYGKNQGVPFLWVLARKNI